MKSSKIISILTMTMVVLFALTTIVSATTIGDIVTVSPDTQSAQTITGVGNKIIGLIQVAGTLVAVAMVLVLGIKYMMGSAEEKAANKKSMMPYLIGAILLFVGANAVSIIYNWANSL